MTTRVGVVGGGLAGSLLAIFLARRGFAPVVVERGPGYDDDSGEQQGRTINLALAARGIDALESAEVFADLQGVALPMAGRIVHERDTTQRFLPYGQRQSERIYSVTRHDLNRKLCVLARERYGIEYRFEHECVGVDAVNGTVVIDGPAGRYVLDSEVVIAADGAGSTVRKALGEARKLSASEDMLDHGYKELGIPPDAAGRFALDPMGLHIWPRGEFMLIALPNPDRTFTATLFMPLRGAISFESVTARGVEALFEEQFPDARPLISNLRPEYETKPIGRLGTVSCRPWSYLEKILLLGDAAHAIVPFHGQGMNAAFEDCAALDRLLAAHGADWATVFARFERERAENASAIAAMALENYREMRDEVRDPAFVLRSELAFELERRYPNRFIPRYAMVMFHPEISYAQARLRGRRQNEILNRLTAGLARVDEVDFDRAAALVDSLL